MAAEPAKENYTPIGARVDDVHSKLPGDASKEQPNPYMTSIYIIALINFCAGIEYSVVMPNLWLYISTELAPNADDSTHAYFYGVALGIFSFSNCFARPSLALWADKSRNFRLVYAVSLCIAIIGNLMFTLANNFEPWTAMCFVTAARFITGIGAGNSNMQYGYITRSTSKQERTSIMSRIGVAKMTSMALGPAINIFFPGWDYQIGPFHVTSLSAPGIVVAVALAVVLLIQMTSMIEPPYESDDDDSDGTDDDERRASANSAAGSGGIGVPCMEVTVIALFMVTMYFNLGTVEAAVTPVAVAVFHWTPVKIGYIFTAMTVELIVLSLFVSKVSKRHRGDDKTYVRDREFMAAGAVILLAGSILCRFWWKPAMSVVHLLVPMLAVVAAYPFIPSPTRSLFSKLIEGKSKTPTFHQACLGFASSFGQMLGPLFAAQAMDLDSPQFTNNLFNTLVAWNMAMVALVVVFYGRLRTPPERKVDERCVLHKEMFDVQPALHLSYLTRLNRMGLEYGGYHTKFNRAVHKIMAMNKVQRHFAEVAPPGLANIQI